MSNKKNHEAVRERDIQKPEAYDRVNEAVRAEAEAEGRAQQQQTAQAPVQEAVQVLAETRQVLQLLEENKPAEAVEALAGLLGKLEILVARHPELQLLPLGQRSEVIDIHADIDSIKDAEKKAKKLLEKGDIQAARHVMRYLASEVVLYNDFLPLAEFPAYVKRVVPLIDKGSLDEARQALVAALNRVVTVENIVPLPLVRAQLLLEQARKQSEQENTDRDELLQLVDSARYQLEMAEILGYGHVEEDYPELYETLETLRKQLKGDESGKESFLKLDKAISALRSKVFEPKHDKR